MNNLVVDILPQCYRENAEQKEIADALTRSVSITYETLNYYLDNYYNFYLNPETCLPQWLDILAHYSGWGAYWDSSWEILVKRILLINTDYIWRNRGNKIILPYLFNIFKLTVKFEPSNGFILSVSTLPELLLSDPFSYRVVIPQAYYVGSPQYILINRLIKQFLPCWVTVNIVFQ